MKVNHFANRVLPLTQNKQPSFSKLNRDFVADLKSHFRLKIFRCGSEQCWTALEIEHAMDFRDESELLIYGGSSEQRRVRRAPQFLLNRQNVS